MPKQNRLKTELSAKQSAHATSAKGQEEVLRLRQELEELQEQLRHEVEKRKIAELAMLRSDRSLLKISDHINYIIARFDKELRHTYVSGSLEQSLGVAPEQLLHKTHEELGAATPAVRSTLAKIENVFGTGETEEDITFLPTPQGEKSFHTIMMPEFDEQGNVESVLTVSRDLTTEVFQEKLLSEVFDSTRLSITAMRAVRNEAGEIVDFKWILVNKNAELVLRHSARQLMNRSVMDLLPGVAATGLLDRMVQVVETGRPHRESIYYDYEFFKSWYELSISKFGDGLLLTYRDVTEQREIALALKKANQELQQKVRDLQLTEAQLQQEQEVLTGVIEHAVDAICGVDQDGRFTVWNRAMEAYSKILREQALGRRVFDIYPEIEKTKIGEEVKRMLQGEQVFIGKTPFSQRGGYYELQMVPTFDRDRNLTGGVIIMHDITESIKLKELTIQQRLQQQKSTMQVVLQTQEEERKRIAEALHNGLGQLLYGIKLHLQQATCSDESAKAKIAEIGDLLEEAIKETRTISFELMPSILQDFGLKVALAEFCKKLSRAHISISLLSYHADSRFDQDIEVAAYRMVQELVNNAIKHAKASVVEVEVEQQGSQLQLQVCDNGIGLQPGIEQGFAQGLGLHSIRNRIKLMGGKLRISAKDGKGTQVRLTVPL